MAAATAVVAATLVALALAGRADAFVYWGNPGDGQIGRANLDGSGADPGFVQPAVGPCGIAVDDQHLYWANGTGLGTSTIGRSNLDGSNVQQDFITGADDPCGVAVDDQHVYWANFGNGTIGRANLDGSGVDQSFVTGAQDPCGIAVSDTSIYWTNGGVAIGRAAIDGSNPNPNLITGINDTCAPMAVNSAHIYFGASLNSIGRANLDGSGLDPNFVQTGTNNGLCGVGVDDEHVYWGNSNSGGVGRSNLDGSNPDPGFIAAGSDTCSVAADDLLRPTETTITCAPSQVAAAQPSQCDVVVSDTGSGVATSPPGKVTLTSSDPGGGAFSPAGECTLAASADGSSSTCTVSYAGPRTANLLALYEGDPGSHESSSAVAGVTVSAFSLGTVTRDRKHGTATVVANAPGPGTISLAGKGLNPDSTTLTSAGPVTLSIKGNRQLRRKLKRRGKQEVTAVVTFTPSGGGQTSQSSVDVTLSKKAKKKKKG
jgi:hypothetical protein